MTNRLVTDPEAVALLAAQVADRTGYPAAHIEKDFWVTEVLRGVTRTAVGLGIEIVFKGGTSLGVDAKRFTDNEARHSAVVAQPNEQGLRHTEPLGGLRNGQCGVLGDVVDRPIVAIGDPRFSRFATSASAPIVVGMITYVTGDATQPVGKGARIVVHVCNDIGAWGAGFVLAVSRRWREPEAEYKAWYRDRKKSPEVPFELGRVQFVSVAEQLWVANMIGQRDIKRSRSGESPVRYDAIASCLKHVAGFAMTNAASVHMPRIGSGLAGGHWNRIEAIISETLTNVDVTVYDLPSK